MKKGKFKKLLALFLTVIFHALVITAWLVFKPLVFIKTVGTLFIIFFAAVSIDSSYTAWRDE
ncbi:MAG: hypothetical protein M0R38_13145 [Bacteroidia bacterium]|nr:hypothetical protein [Bacteroidia bacterium]